MIYREHLIEIFANGEKLELENQRSINLRMNNVLFNPEKVSSPQADYSFSFDIPSTPKNDRILNHANNLSKLNKFHVRYNAQVYADGKEIFHGNLIVNGYADKKYNVNLVQVKMNNIDDIFGDAKLTDIPWYVPFDGAVTINQTNADTSSTVTFPLVCYGAFQKDPVSSDEVANTYTSKFDIDRYNRWWIESFYPSLNMVETVKKAFEWKGYTVYGDALTDPMLSDVFMSPNLASEQVPTYNLANPRLGKVQLSATLTTSGDGYEQELEFPYFNVYNARGHFGGSTGVADRTLEAWNWEDIRIYDLLKNGSSSVNDTYMYDPNEKCIVIPADGFYKIDLQVSSRLSTAGNLTVMQNMITNGGSGNDIEQKNVTITPSFLETTPIEIQLVRNYEDNCELIKGKHNREYINGNPTQTTNYNGQSNIRNWETCFPHEDPYASIRPTNTNNLTVKSSSRYSSNFIGSTTSNSSSSSSSSEGGTSTGTGGTSAGGHFSGRRGRAAAPTAARNYSTTVYGYVPMDGEIMGFDQAVADNFICGFSSFLGGTGSVMKNGYSWSKSSAIENFSFYNCGYKNTSETVGYRKMVSEEGNIVYQNSDYGYNSWPNAPQMTINANQTGMDGTLSCMVWLNKNDILELFAIQRAYETTGGTSVNYSTNNTVQLTIEAASPNSMAFLRYQGYNYNSPSQFDYDLKVTNFLNEETTISSFIDGVQKAFNLQIRQDANNVWIDVVRNQTKHSTYAVDLDDRVNSAEAESGKIEYPKSMSVQYKIDEDEWGFERSVQPQSMLNQPDWKDYADRGYSIIELNDDSYVTETSDISIPFSYTWYDNFNWKEVGQDDTETGSELNIRMPVLSKFTYMIDGYDYDESMKHDGYSLTQRFWFRPDYTTAYVWLDSKPAERIQIFLPENQWSDGTNLSYKTTEDSLLKYFNTTPYLSSNYVEIEAYLSPEEYNDLKNGAMVHFDSDLFYVSELQGFDPSGVNPTKIKMIKKVN